MMIRQARLEDLPVLVDYNRRLAEETEGKILDPEVLTRGVEALLKDRDKGFYFVAERDGRVVGQLMITREWSDWRHGWMWWIQSVYVAREARRQGFFRALHQHVLDEARRNPEVVGLRLYVEEENVAAQRTYRSLGMEQTSYRLMEQGTVEGVPA